MKWKYSSKVQAHSLKIVKAFNIQGNVLSYISLLITTLFNVKFKM